MPFGLNYAGQFDSFTYSTGMVWLIFTFIYLFCFSYLALRGKENAWRMAIIVTVLSLVANIILVHLGVSIFTSIVLGIGAYLLISVFVSGMGMKDLLKVTCIITVNFLVSSLVPDFLGWFYDIFLLYIFYLISENRLEKEANPSLAAPPR